MYQKQKRKFEWVKISHGKRLIRAVEILNKTN